MAINRFWGQAPVAQYSPRTFQEMAFAPQQMYEREKELSAKVDAMNESSATLQSMLGEKAPIPEQFNTQYQQILDKIAREGATPQALDAARQLKKTYIQEVVPIELYAKDREKYQTEWAKAAMDKNNILIGNKPIDVSFEQYRKDPSSLQFSTMGRDKLYTYGAKAGDEYAKSFLNQGKTDARGNFEVWTGFRSPQEVAAKMQSDPKFAANVNESMLKIMAANGIPADNKDAADAIMSGMLSAMVGKASLEKDSLWLANETARRTAALTTSKYPVEVRSMAARSLTELPESAMASPRVMQAVDSEAKKRGFSSMAELNNAIEQLSTSKPSPTSDYERIAKENPMTGGFIIGAKAIGEAFEGSTKAVLSPGKYKGKSLQELQAMRDEISGTVTSSPDFGYDSGIWPETVEGSMIDPKLTKQVKDTIDEFGQSLDRRIGTYANQNQDVYGGIDQPSRDAISQYSKSTDKDKKIVVKDIRINASRGANGEVLGSGYPTVVVDLISKDGKETVPREAVLHLPLSEMRKILNVPAMLSYNSDNAQEIADLIGAAGEFYREQESYLSNKKKQ